MAIIEQKVPGSITGTFDTQGNMIGAAQNIVSNFIDTNTQEIVSTSYNQLIYNTKEEFLEAIGVSS